MSLIFVILGLIIVALIAIIIGIVVFCSDKKSADRDKTRITREVIIPLIRQGNTAKAVKLYQKLYKVSLDEAKTEVAERKENDLS